jgi:long-chain acyl-CoA synthetase
MDDDVTSEAADAARYAARAASLTIPMLLHRNATEFGDLPALSMLGHEETLTWAAVRDRVADLSYGLAGIGLRSGDRVLISMSGRFEHWLVDLAATHLGAVPCTAYATLSTDQLRYLAQHSAAPVVVVEGTDQLNRWAPVLDEVPTLRVVMVVDRSALDAAQSTMDSPKLRDAVTVANLEALGAQARRAQPELFEQRWRAIRPEQPLTLLYTSGTTGDPKGVMISHFSAVYQTIVLEAKVPVPDHPRSVAYLPLAHIAERMLGIYNPIYRAGHVLICPDPTQLIAALQAAHPDSFFGVPRVWEKMAGAVQARFASLPPEQKAVVDTATTLAREAFWLRADGKPVPEDLAVRLAQLDAAVLAPTRTMLGLDRMAWGGTGAAPIPVDILVFLAGLGIDILEVWGMTETTGTGTINLPDAFRPGTVGRVNPGMEIRIADDGELLIKGPLVCMGYLRPDGGIDRVTDDEGWLATGDVGTIDEDGYLTITDRKKELIITSGGKNIAPAQIESLLRAHPLIAQAVAIGDRRPYVTALIVLDDEVAPQWAAAHGVAATRIAALAEDPTVRAEIQAAVDAANEKLSRPEQVKAYRIMASSWTPETGELTPTLKLRRRVITDKHHAEIDALYT